MSAIGRPAALNLHSLRAVAERELVPAAPPPTTLLGELLKLRQLSTAHSSRTRLQTEASDPKAA